MSKERKNNKEYLKGNIKQEYLPVKLIEKINQDIFNTDFDYRKKNNFLRCIATIYFKQVNEYHSLEYYVPTGAAYWKSIFGGDYHEKVIQPLIDFNIIQYHDFGFRNYNGKDASYGKGKPTGSVGIRYRIHTELTDDDRYEIIEYINKGTSTVLTAEESLNNNSQEFEYQPISDKKFYVSIDKQKACQWVDDNAGLICEEYLKPTYADDLPQKWVIQYHLFLDGGSFDTNYGSIKSAKFIAGLHGKELFFFKDSFYIADLQKFMEYRVEALKYHYKHEISKINQLPIIDKRSTKTLRLSNHLVNFPSKILKFININNQTVFQLDLRTSQFLLFANLLNTYINSGGDVLIGLFKKPQTKRYLRRLIKVLNERQDLLPKVGVDITNHKSGKHSSSDVIKFISDVFYSDFYVVVQKHLELPDRGLAKQILFKLLFSRGNKSDILINKLKEKYPTTMSIIAGFKQNDEEQQMNDKSKKNDISNFSVFLQCIEAEIFVYNIFYPLRDSGLPCFTRHDSLVVANGYEAAAELFAKTVFAKFGFKYNHKVEEKFWDVVDLEELENSGYLDWFADENEFNTTYFIESRDYVNEPNIINEMNELQSNTCLKLKKIGLHSEYYDYVDADFLEEISNLPLLIEYKNILSDDIINLRNGYTFLQDKTNVLLSYLISIIEENESVDFRNF